jgi:transposase InsO family protein
MREHKNHYSIREMTGVFGASAGACCKWTKLRVPAERSKRDAELLDLIRGIVERHHRRYGSPRVREAPRDDDGKRIGRNKTARLMRADGLNARRRGEVHPRRRLEPTGCPWVKTC